MARPKIALKHLALESVRSQVHRASYDLPLDLSAENTEIVILSRNDSVIVYRVAYVLAAHDQRQRLVWDMACSFVLIYKADQVISADFASEFAPSILPVAHSYLREFVQECTMRMNIPPLVLDLFRQPVG